MTGSSHMIYVAAAYGVAFVTLGLLALATWRAWHRAGGGAA